MSVNAVAAESVNPQAFGARASVERPLPAEATRDAKKILEAATQFESLFMRQILKTARFGGSGSESGYGGMVVDALATGVSENGGMGLAKAITDSLARTNLRAAAAKSASFPVPQAPSAAPAPVAATAARAPAATSNAKEKPAAP